MMAMMWPNWKYYELNTINSAVFVTGLSSAVLPINKARTKAINRIGPHNKEILDILISGMLGDFWADKIPGKALNSVRFNIEQSISNTAYIHYLSLLFYKLGYCSRPVPTLIVKSPAALGGFKLTSSRSLAETRGKGGQIPTEGDSSVEKRFNYKLTLFTFSSFTWIYDSFYITVNGKTIKTVPVYISDYLTPLGLAHLVMQTGVKENEVLTLSLRETNFINIYEFNLIKEALLNKYNIKSDIMLNRKGYESKVAIRIKKDYLLNLSNIIAPHMPLEFSFLLNK
jgi:hypothetical protein